MIDVDDDHPTTEELKAVQIDRVDAERDAAARADDPDEQRAHDRRADKASYLAEKLREQGEVLDS